MCVQTAFRKWRSCEITTSVPGGAEDAGNITIEDGTIQIPEVLQHEALQEVVHLGLWQGEEHLLLAPHHP